MSSKSERLPDHKECLSEELSVRKKHIGQTGFQRILLVIFSLLFGIGVVSISVFRVSQAQVYGVDSSEEQSQEKVESSEEVEFEKSVDYYLPYPGILPDHPLYWLKMLRDRVLLILTKKPSLRLERLLLYADKRVGAAEVLIKGNKKQLGVTTITKAEKYLGQAIGEYEKIVKEGDKDLKLKKRLMKAILKHRELLVSLVEKIKNKNKEVVEEILKRNSLDLRKVYDLGKKDGEVEKIMKILDYMDEEKKTP